MKEAGTKVKISLFRLRKRQKNLVNLFLQKLISHPIQNSNVNALLKKRKDRPAHPRGAPATERKIVVNRVVADTQAAAAIGVSQVAVNFQKS